MLNKLFNRDTPEREDGLVPVAKVSELAQGKLKRVNVKGQSVVLALAEKADDQIQCDVVAFSSICPHALGDLSQGWLAGDEIDCPMHYYRFDARTGECRYPKGGPGLRVYPVTVEDGVILLKVEPPKWMDTSAE
jgi:nitrite reductase/ring-hydroxylating ferredoxin subunit